MITIRQAHENDIDLLNDLSGHGDDEYWPHCFDESWRDIFVACLDEGDVGYCMLNWQPRYHLFRKLHIPEIQDLHVIETARQKGVGTAMVAYCENRAREQKCEYIGIGVGLHKDYGPAQRLYVKMGYVPDGYGIVYNREPVSYGDRVLVDNDLNLMMIKQLKS